MFLYRRFIRLGRCDFYQVLRAFHRGSRFRYWWQSCRYSYSSRCGL